MYKLLVAASITFCAFTSCSQGNEKTETNDTTTVAEVQVTETVHAAAVETVEVSAESAATEPYVENDPHTPAESSVVKPADTVYKYVDQMPEFKGDIYRYLAENTKYPQSARDNGIEGRVGIKFVIKADGSITNVEVSRGDEKVFEEEAIRVVKNMPPWKPGKKNGQPVNVEYVVPVTFRLD